MGLVIGMAGLVVFGSRSRITILTAWIALGTAGFIRAFPSHAAAFRLSVGFLVFGIFAMRVLTLMSSVDAAHDLRAETFGREIPAAPKDAIIFAKGDQAVFALWYFHFVLKERLDLIVIAEDRLHFDWYQETLQKTYPSLVVPGPFPWLETIVQANSLRAICPVQYSGRTEVDCSKPLTPP